MFQVCPKCQICIEKNGGCNHMQCYGCKHDFCWMCLGDWKTHGSEYYRCSRYEENPNVANESSHARAKEALKKYLHYFERVIYSSECMPEHTNFDFYRILFLGRRTVGEPRQEFASWRADSSTDPWTDSDQSHDRNRRNMDRLAMLAGRRSFAGPLQIHTSVHLPVCVLHGIRPQERIGNVTSAQFGRTRINCCAVTVWVPAGPAGSRDRKSFVESGTSWNDGSRRFGQPDGHLRETPDHAAVRFPPDVMPNSNRKGGTWRIQAAFSLKLKH